MLGPMVIHGFDACRAAQETVQVVGRTQLALGVIRDDLRRAVEVVPAPADSGEGEPGEGRLLFVVRFREGESAAYVLRGASLLRCEAPSGTEDAPRADLPEGWPRRALPGRYADVLVSPVPGAQRVWQVEMSAPMAGMRARSAGAVPVHDAHFVTAVYSRPEAMP